jgi:hypothetical protein
MVPFGMGNAYGCAPDTHFNNRLQHNACSSYTQPNVLQLNAFTWPRPTTIQEVMDRFNANLAKQMRDD